MEPVAHRATLIEQQMAAQVGFYLELIEVVADGAREKTPVQITHVIARRVGAIFCELNRKAVIGAPVQAVQNPSTTTRARNSRFRMAMSALGSTNPASLFDGIELAESGPRIKIHYEAPGSLTVSNNRRITVSTLVPSASAR